MATENTMAIFRHGERAQRLQQQTRAAIDPFIPKEYRQRLHYELFLRCAAAQLEGKQFRAESLIPALATFAMAGILPDKSRHHGYLVPYSGVVTPIFGYQGLIHLAYQARSANGAVLLDVVTDLILDGDEYDDSLPQDEMVRSHRPRGDRDPHEDPKNGLRYAYARFKYGIAIGGIVERYDRIQVLARGELKAVRSDRGDGWKAFPFRMYQKAPIRRACQSGRVELAYMAGMALTAEGAGEGGDIRGYARAVADMARAAGADTNALQDAIGVVEVNEAENEKSATDQYLAAAETIHANLGSNTCTLEQADNYMARLAELRKHYGLAFDEKADALYQAIKREYERNE